MIARSTLLQVLTLLFMQISMAQIHDPLPRMDFNSEFNFSINGYQGQSTMGQFVRAGGGVSVGYMKFLANSKFAVGADMGISVYGYRSFEELYYFNIEDWSTVDVEVINSFSLFNLHARYFMNPNKAINSYLAARGGLALFRSNLTIEDPRANHTIDCPVPLVSDILLSDNAPTYSLGGGIQLDIARIFTRFPSQVVLDLGVNLIRGAKVQYMSHRTPPTNFRDPVGNVLIGFANEREPDIVHDYHSGYSYRTAIHLIEYSIKAAYRF